MKARLKKVIEVPAQHVSEMHTGHTLTGQYLVDVATILNKETISEKQKTRLEGFFAAIEGAKEKDVKDAIKDFSKLAPQSGLNVKTVRRMASQFRGIYRATVVSGSAAWAAGLGLHAASDKAREIMVANKVMPNGNPRKDKAEKAASKAEHRQTLLIVEATKIAGRTGISIATDSEGWFKCLAEAENNAAADWAKAFAKTLFESQSKLELAKLTEELQALIK